MIEGLCLETASQKTDWVGLAGIWGGGVRNKKKLIAQEESDGKAPGQT